MVGTNIVLLVKPSATIVTEVVSALLPFGIKLARYFTEDVPQGKQLTLIVSESNSTSGGVVEHLLEINGVLTVLETPWTSDLVKGIDNALDSSGGARFDGRLVDNVADAFPVVLPLLVAFEESVSGSDRGNQLRLLGAEVGAALAQDYPHLENCVDVSSALRDGVLPLLNEVADATIRNGGIELQKSIFTRNDLNAASGTGADGLCAFCEGLMEGFVRISPALANMRVTETRCRDKGDTCCAFEIE